MVRILVLTHYIHALYSQERISFMLCGGLNF